VNIAEMYTSSDSSHVTVPYKLSFVIIIIKTNLSSLSSLNSQNIMLIYIHVVL